MITLPTVRPDATGVAGRLVSSMGTVERYTSLTHTFRSRGAEGVAANAAAGIATAHRVIATTHARRVFRFVFLRVLTIAVPSPDAFYNWTVCTNSSPPVESSSEVRYHWPLMNRIGMEIVCSETIPASSQRT